MEVLKRKILLEDSIDRTLNSPTWGIVTATTFFINVSVMQTIDDMGLFTDMSYISKSNLSQSQPDYTILTQKLSASGLTFPFMVGLQPLNMTGLTETDNITLKYPANTVSNYYHFGNLVITGSTDSKLDDLRSYNLNNPFIPGFNILTEQYIDYNNVSLSGVSRVVLTGNPYVYVFDTLDNAQIGTNNQIYGLLYKDFSGLTRTVTSDGVTTVIPDTEFRYIGQGINETNISLSALTKEEYLFGIISPPEVQNDVFIDRGVISVMDMHLRLSEIKDLSGLAKYGNGYYNLTTQ